MNINIKKRIRAAVSSTATVNKIFYHDWQKIRLNRFLLMNSQLLEVSFEILI